MSAGVFGEAWVVLALSIACNLDNLSVGVAYGLARIRIRTVANLAIALVAVVLTAGSVGVAISQKHRISVMIEITA